MDGEQPYLRKVPPELWEEIFAIACSLSSEHGYSLTIISHDYRWHLVRAFPIILIHICSRWRQIGIRCPRLWAFIDIQLRSNTGFPRGEKNLVQMYLANSAMYPLRVRVCFGYRMSDVARTTWEILTGHSSRFEQLILECNSYVLPSLRGQSNPFNNLVFFGHAAGLYKDDGEVDIYHPFWKALCQAPKLTEVQSQRFRPRHLLPYQQLTTLIVGNIDEGDVRDLLRALEVCKNLHSLTLGTFQDPQHRLDRISSCVELPSLHTLSICSDITQDGWDSPKEVLLARVNNSILEVLFTSFVLPSLLTFRLASASSSDSFHTHWPASLLILLQRSTTLRHMSLSLNFGETCHSWEPLSILLKSTPHITHFQLNDDGNERFVISIPPDFITSFLSDLADTQHSGNIILPELVHLTLATIELTDEIGDMIIAAAASRSPVRLSAAGADVISQLEELNVMHYEYTVQGFTLKPDMLEAMEGLKLDGVKVVIEESDMDY